MSLIKTPEEIKVLREGGKRLANIILRATDFIKPGVSTAAIDAYAEKLFIEAQGTPSFKGFQGYPAATCISINEEVVHGIPSDKKIVQEGDIVDIDIGLCYKELYTDMSVTVGVGKVSAQAKRLMAVTRRSLELGIAETRPGQSIGDIGFAVQTYAERFGYGVVSTLVGHGVGHAVHEEPRVPNVGKRGGGMIIEEGMVIAIEPMLNIGGAAVSTNPDGWTVVTADGSLSAHFEHTIAVTKQGPVILTQL